jgi:hypothetical protein
MSKILLPGKDFPYQEESEKSDWYCYESKAGVPLTDVDGNKFTEREALQPGMEVFSTHFLSGHQFKATITLLDPDGEEKTLVASDGANLYHLVFEEGYWGYTSAVNMKAIRRVEIHGVDT